MALISLVSSFSSAATTSGTANSVFSVLMVDAEGVDGEVLERADDGRNV